MITMSNTTEQPSGRQEWLAAFAAWFHHGALLEERRREVDLFTEDEQETWDCSLETAPYLVVYDCNNSSRSYVLNLEETLTSATELAQDSVGDNQHPYGAVDLDTGEIYDADMCGNFTLNPRLTMALALTIYPRCHCGNARNEQSGPDLP
jgi:hypothetical protein